MYLYPRYNNTVSDQRADTSRCAIGMALHIRTGLSLTHSPSVHGNTNTAVFRQITGPCGEAVDDSELLSWAASYDGSTDDAGDDPPTAGDSGRSRFYFVPSVYGTDVILLTLHFRA